jgi:hypothetical protein
MSSGRESSIERYERERREIANPSAPVREIARSVVAGLEDPFSGPPPYLTNLDDSKPDHQDLIARAMNGRCLAADDVINLPMDLVAAICHPAESVDEETGEVSTWPRTVLVLADGTLVAFGSRGIVKALQMLTRFHGRGPWYPPVKVVLRQQKVAENKRWYYLEQVRDQPAQMPREAR